MKIMTFTPYGERLEPETVTAVLALEYEHGVTHVFQHMPQTGKPRADILAQYRRGRELFLSSDCDALLIVESDIIPPPDALRKLIALNADCAYGVYRFRASDVVNVYERYPGTPRNEGESLSLSGLKLQWAVNAQHIDMTGGGLGCVLIKRSALEQVQFRLEETAHCDTWFNRDVFTAGLRQRADMTVICGHKDTDGRILWPKLPGVSN